MASKMAASASLTAAKFKKYTVQPTGIYAWMSRIFNVDHTRSSGIPLNPQFRNPPPGALDPKGYDDPVTLPAADIAENPYWKRDMRRRYPQQSVLSQGDVVALLSVGSAGKEKVELIGDAGAKQLVAVKEEGQKGIAAYLEKSKGVGASILDADGLPPRPAMQYTSPTGEKRYELIPESEQTYGEGNVYPCRTFI